MARRSALQVEIKFTIQPHSTDVVVSHRYIFSSETTQALHPVISSRRGTCPKVTFDGCVFPQKEEVMFLGIYLDKRLTWTKHIWLKKLQLNVWYDIKENIPVIGHKFKIDNM